MNTLSYHNRALQCGLHINADTSIKKVQMLNCVPNGIIPLEISLPAGKSSCKSSIKAVRSLRIGAVNFGGGYAMLPLLERDLVQDRGWTTTQDLTDYFAIGQCTPGLIALNVATFIGSRRKGVAGAIAATLGFVTIPIIIILIIATFLQGFADMPVVQNAFAGIRVCVCVLIVQAVLRLWKKSVVDKVSLCLYIGVFLMTALSGVLPVAVPAAILVITSGILGVIIGGFRDNNGSKKEAEKKS